MYRAKPLYTQEREHMPLWMMPRKNGKWAYLKRYINFTIDYCRHKLTN